MKILCLYNNPIAEELFEWIKLNGYDIVLWQKKPDIHTWKKEKYDLAVSYTYKYILTDKEQQSLEYNAVNLHNSYLPWNRGANPNLWSIVDGTPKGVTLHYMDENLDKAAKEMFKKAFSYYPFWPEMKKEVLGKGTYHSVEEGKSIIKGIKTIDIVIKDYLKINYCGNDLH